LWHADSVHASAKRPIRRRDGRMSCVWTWQSHRREILRELRRDDDAGCTSTDTCSGISAITGARACRRATTRLGTRTRCATGSTHDQARTCRAGTATSGH